MANPRNPVTTETVPSRVPLLDVCRQTEPLAAEIVAEFEQVFRTGQFVLGPAVEAFEAAVADYCGTGHAVGCASGSDALLLALMALEIGPGDEVIVPSYTFFATASAVARLGAKIVFADIDPCTYNLDVTDIERRITPATRAIIAVHLFGRCADMDPLRQLADRHDLRVVEDAAQAIGAEYGTRRAGSLSDVGCFSFYPTKNLGGAGDGGMLTTDDAALADRFRLLRGHGMRPRYYHSVIGINSRLDSLQAAVLNVKLKYLDGWTQQRAANAGRYSELLRRAELEDLIGLPEDDSAGRHVWNQYTVRVGRGLRDPLREHLQACDIGTEIYYPVPLHRQACFRELGYGEGSLPETERAAGETLALPIFPELTVAEQHLVVERIAQFCQAHRKSAAA